MLFKALRNDGFVGKKFGKLVASHSLPASKKVKARVICKCDCGRKTILVAKEVYQGRVTSCGEC